MPAISTRPSVSSDSKHQYYSSSLGSEDRMEELDEAVPRRSSSTSISGLEEGPALTKRPSRVARIFKRVGSAVSLSSIFAIDDSRLEEEYRNYSPEQWEMMRAQIMATAYIF